MIRLVRPLVLATALIAGAGAYGAQPPANPSQGDGELSAFYLPPPELPSEPGRLIRREDLPARAGLPAAASSTRILYSSTDGVGGRERIAVSGALFLPKGAPPEGGWPVVAWAHGTVGIADSCAPSWTGRSPRDISYLGRWLEEGFAVVSSDYQGLGVPGPHPYLFARPGAYSILDSVRAVLSGVPGLNADKVVVVGQSQGGGAAFATAGFWPDYAPELKLRGVVATGVPYLTRSMAASAPQPDLDKVDPTIAYTFYIALTAPLALSPAPDPSRLFTPRAMPLFEGARAMCVGTLFRAVQEAGLTRRNATRPDFIELLGGLAPQFGYPTLKIGVPVFVGTGAEDRDVSPRNQLALVKDSCGAGSIVEAHLYAGLDHSAAVNGALRDSLPFVRKLLAGEAITPRCEPTPE